MGMSKRALVVLIVGVVAVAVVGVALAVTGVVAWMSFEVG